MKLLLSENQHKPRMFTYPFTNIYRIKFLSLKRACHQFKEKQTKTKTNQKRKQQRNDNHGRSWASVSFQLWF